MSKPWIVHEVVLFLFHYIKVFVNWVFPAPLRIHELALAGRVISHVVLSLTELNVAEALLKGPQTIQQLAATVGKTCLVALVLASSAGTNLCN